MSTRLWRKVLGLISFLWVIVGSSRGVLAQSITTPTPCDKPLSPAEARALVNTIRCVRFGVEQYCFGLGFIVIPQGSPEWYNFWVPPMIAGLPDGMWVCGILKERLATPLNVLRQRDAAELELARQSMTFVTMVNTLSAGGNLEAFENHPMLNRKSVDPTMRWVKPTTHYTGRYLYY